MPAYILLKMKMPAYKAIFYHPILGRQGRGSSLLKLISVDIGEERILYQKYI